MASKRLHATLGSLVLLAIACAFWSETPEQSAEREQGPPPGHPVTGGEGSLNGEATGVVLEAHDGGGYTYAKVDFQGVERWVAGPPASLAAGDTVAVLDLVNMGAFKSERLGREFDELFFTSGFRQASGVVTPTGDGFQHEGFVEEVIVTRSYVIALVDSGEEALWVAGPVTEVREGDRIGWNAGTLMTEFWSPSLDRTFDEILFVPRVFVLNQVPGTATEGAR